MREIRTYGSVRGVARKGHPYRDKIGIAFPRANSAKTPNARHENQSGAAAATPIRANIAPINRHPIARSIHFRRGETILFSRLSADREEEPVATIALAILFPSERLPYLPLASPLHARLFIEVLATVAVEQPDILPRSDTGFAA
jgi:hypothetical protein